MSSAVDEWEASRYAERRLRERLAPFAPSRGTAIGLVLAMAFAVGCLWAGGIWPGRTAANLTDGTAVVLPDGRMYLVDAGTLHPVTNRTSVLLAAEHVEHRPQLALEGYPIGEPRGIPAALSALPEPDALLEADWQLCSGPRAVPTLTVGGAPYLPPAAGEATVLTDGTQLWLVSGGLRTALSPGELDAGSAIRVAPELVSLLPESSHTPSAPVVAGPGSSEVACVQSDPSAPFALPSVAALADDRRSPAPANNGTQVVLPAGSGLLARQPDGTGYLLLSYTAELAPITDDQALARLGYAPSQAVDVPAPLVALLAPGPELSIAAARAPLVPRGS